MKGEMRKQGGWGEREKRELDGAFQGQNRRASAFDGHGSVIPLPNAYPIDIVILVVDTVV